MRLSCNISLFAAASWTSCSIGVVQSFTSPRPCSFLTKIITCTSHDHYSKRSTISILANSKSGDEDGDGDADAWDYDEDYSDDDTASKSNSPRKTNLDGTPNLGINIGTQLEPLSKEQAEELKQEATEAINSAFGGRMDEISDLKTELNKDFERSKENMRFASDLRAKEQTDRLMSKIDKISDKFLSENEELRMGTKMAAGADRNMAGKGMDVGSWGKIGGMNVLTSAAGGASVGLLGSVSAGNINAAEDSAESMIEVDTQVKGEEEDERIMVVCDDKDKGFKKVLNRFQDLLNDQFANPVTIDTYAPSSIIPMGAKNAKCAIIVSTSLSNGQSSAENILGRVLKRTLAPGGGGVSKPPTHIVVVSPVGTERIESFPYSMQNMMGGGKLKKAREVEEVAISTVKGRFIADDASIPSLDYTIVKLGEIVDDAKIASKQEGAMEIQSGDSLDGKVGVEAAANVLFRSIALQPTARNATLSVIGAMDKAECVDGVEEEVWEDYFLRLRGPELWRSEVLAEGDSDLDRKFEELSNYMNAWSDRFNNGAKGTGLTTPVTVSPSRFLDDIEGENPSIVRKYGVRFEFKQTNTGFAYKSKSEEREVEKLKGGQSSSGAAPIKTAFQKKEGGIEVLVEEVTRAGKRQLRVRARRCNMDDATVVKELSEQTILKNLGKAVEVWKKEQ